ncbi:hypothetical protein HDU87_003097 [Geranomyces variabilis]|uniref:Uncharacterized protein n=1 Tax=Geranomyces variabilis TaxID=109894 RepID=A0AAD5TL05_9FUNG|nr:hypothetical protein HDU87_003097 [Geranomyces variabilis]
MSYETKPELQARLENRALATQLEADERQKAQVEQLVSEAQTDLMRKIAAKDAIAASEEERARRIAEAALAQAQEQLVRNANVQKAIALEEEEQRRRASEMSGTQAPDLAERKAVAERVEGLADAERARRLSTGDEFELRPQKRQLEESLVQKVAERRASRTSATDLSGSAAPTAAGSTNGGSYSYSSGSAQTDANVPRSAAQSDHRQQEEAEPSGIRAVLAKAASVITGRT